MLRYCRYVISVDVDVSIPIEKLCGYSFASPICEERIGHSACDSTHVNRAVYKSVVFDAE